jgi:hypothetical protein
VPPEENIGPRATRRGATAKTSTTDLPSYPDVEHDAGVGPEGGSAAGAPGWISVFGIVIVILVVVMLVVLHLTGAIGPGLH